MTGEFIVAKLKNLESIDGADKIQQAKIFGETVIIPTTHKEGELGILFDCETQLSEHFVHHNNLYRKGNMNYDKDKVGYIEENRRIRPIKLRGVKCSGLWMPVESLKNIPELHNFNVEDLKEGEQYKSVGGINISDKYVSPKTGRRIKSKEGRAKINLTPTFKEHVDTDQFMRNLNDLNKNLLVTITEKLHGTSGRVGYLPVIQKPNWFDVVISLFKKPTEKTSYGFVVGSRRVVKSVDGGEVENKEHFYNEDLWTKIGLEFFKNKLHKGETVYFEIVGFTPDGGHIMPFVSNEKLKNFLDKKEYQAFLNRYGQTTEFTYGCTRDLDLKPTYMVYVYRITTTNEDGVSYDLSWDQIKIRSEELGLNHVPELDRRIINQSEIDDGSYVEFVEKIVTDESEQFPSHIREGVVVRIDTGKKTPIFLKHKSFIFKVLEGIIKEKDDVVDMEEAN